MGALASQASERSTKAVRTSKPPLAPNPRHREPTNPKTVHGNVYCDRTLPIVSYALTVWYDPFTGLPAMQMWDNCLRPRCPTFSRGRIRAYANSWSADAYPRISSICPRWVDGICGYAPFPAPFRGSPLESPRSHRLSSRRISSYPQISSAPAGVMDGIDGFAPTAQEPTWSVLARVARRRDWKRARRRAR